MSTDSGGPTDSDDFIESFSFLGSASLAESTDAERCCVTTITPVLSKSLERTLSAAAVGSCLEVSWNDSDSISVVQDHLHLLVAAASKCWR